MPVKVQVSTTNTGQPVYQTIQIPVQQATGAGANQAQILSAGTTPTASYILPQPITLTQQAQAVLPGMSRTLL